MRDKEPGRELFPKDHAIASSVSLQTAAPPAVQNPLYFQAPSAPAPPSASSPPAPTYSRPLPSSTPLFPSRTHPIPILPSPPAPNGRQSITNGADQGTPHAHAGLLPAAPANRQRTTRPNSPNRIIELMLDIARPPSYNPPRSPMWGRQGGRSEHAERCRYVTGIPPMFPCPCATSDDPARVAWASCPGPPRPRRGHFRSSPPAHFAHSFHPRSCISHPPTLLDHLSL